MTKKLPYLILLNSSSAEVSCNYIKGIKRYGLLAARQTKCENLILLTDHESDEIELDGHHIKIQPVYEWCLV